MTQINSPVGSGKKARKFGCLAVLGFMLVSIIITAGVTYWILFPKSFKPIELSQKEQVVLDKKLKLFEGFTSGQSPATSGETSLSSKEALAPEAYSEEGTSRELVITERELNSILATNTDLADKVAIDLSDDLISARLRWPMDPDFPFFGGKILKARAGIEFFNQLGRPVVVLKGVSVMGVPVPNSFLGGLKNIDLVSEFGNQGGFWQSFEQAVELAQVDDGALQIKLKE
ncbi:MAG: plasmid maintenance system antidote protein VapI [Cryomorphaceae bacterium]|jgi:plasmid maintenance system antidote protein VapI